MKIVFRLNYHTEPGQSIWLKYAIILGADRVRLDQVTQLHWINHEQWEVSVEMKGAGPVRLEYGYQMRKAANGVELDEWLTPRVAEFDLNKLDRLLLLDTWCSAGAVDHAYETSAFLSMFPAKASYQKLITPKNANHSFQLRMTDVPKGLVPCLLGNTKEIGDWGWHHAVPLQEVAQNVWRKDLYLPADWALHYKYGLYDLRLNCVVSMENGGNRILSPRIADERNWTNVTDEGYRREESGLFHGAGVAIPVFSLRSAEGLGVGEFADLKPLADWANQVGLKLIQILPINDTTASHDWTDSYPYSAISVFALHPMYLRIDDLKYPMPKNFQQEIEKARTSLNALEQVDYEAVMTVKTDLTRRIFAEHGQTILKQKPFKEFFAANRDWLISYAVFCVKRDEFGTADFSEWGDWAIYDAQCVKELADPAHPDFLKVIYHVWLQFELDRQLSDAVTHLHQKGLSLKGDLPIGINRQSVDAWSAPHLFEMEAQTGAPPDAFAVKGQNWGFPTYSWEVMKMDDYAWWRSRFEQLSRYFDAYRIDHILGFFRIWQIPYDQVEGIMGYFDPALPIQIDEIRNRGITFDYNRYCRPYIREHLLWERFGDATHEVKDRFLNDCGEGFWQLRESVCTQRRIEELFETEPKSHHNKWLREMLMDCVSEVLFFEVPGSNGTQFHPRYNLQATRSFQELDQETQWRVDELYVSYFYQRQEEFWEAKGYQKLPAMRRASPMLLCGEDLGMVPACVPGVMKELGILSLEIQRMPKTSEMEFSDPAKAPYMSVVSPSTHDMPTLRAWWREDPAATRRFVQSMLGMHDAPDDMSGELATKIILQHLLSPAMWAIFPLQDLLAMDETLRHSDPEVERINIPVIMPYYWRYRMHLPLADLASADGFNSRLHRLLRLAKRSVSA